MPVPLMWNKHGHTLVLVVMQLTLLGSMAVSAETGDLTWFIAAASADALVMLVLLSKPPEFWQR